jgi:hypothetical protein
MDWIVSSPYAYPVLEATHIFGIALLLGSLMVFELRVWGAGGTIGQEALARLALPVTLAGFGLAALSGGLMFWSQYEDLLANRAFLVKMALLVVAGSNAALFHWRGGLGVHDRIARAQSVLSLAVWMAVIVCGRWIAYV